jgi:hypothetical protein
MWNKIRSIRDFIICAYVILDRSKGANLILSTLFIIWAYITLPIGNARFYIPLIIGILGIIYSIYVLASELIYNGNLSVIVDYDKLITLQIVKPSKIEEENG